MKKILLVIILILLLPLITIKLLNTNKKSIINTPINNNTPAISIMLKDENMTDYRRSDSTRWPTSGYKFNEKLSKCDDGGNITWNKTNKQMTYNGSTSTKCYAYFDELPLFSNYIMNKVYRGIDGVNNIYKHDGIGSYTNASEEACWDTNDDGVDDTCENSYRYSGASNSINNYVCFGYTDESACKRENFLTSDYAYRIIGVFNANDGSAGTSSYQVKLIKNNWLTTTYIGTGQNDTTDTWYWQGMNQEDHNAAYGTDYNNTWSHSTLNSDALNTRYVNALGSTWSSLIEDHIWKVGGNSWGKIGMQTVKTAYTYEIVSNEKHNSTDDLLVSSPTKIGLMYVSDYMYGASPDYWQKYGNNTDHTLDYSSAKDFNWLRKERRWEWIFTRLSNSNSVAFSIYLSGYLSNNNVYTAYGMRPSFYLKSSVTYVSGDGSPSNPFIIGD